MPSLGCLLFDCDYQSFVLRLDSVKVGTALQLLEHGITVGSIRRISIVILNQPNGRERLE